MKFRTDFVTNSSSSSYCASVAIKPVKGDTLSINLYPDDEDGTGDVHVYLTKKAEALAEEFQKCKTVEEIKETAEDALDFKDMFSDYCDDNGIKNVTDLLEALRNDTEIGDDYDGYYYADYSKQVVKTFDDFREKMNKITDIDQINEIVIFEHRTGWGEFARNGVSAFLKAILPAEMQNYDKGNLGEIEEYLTKILPKGAVDSLMNQITDDTICAFDAGITTIVNMKTGNITKKYMFEEL